MKVFYYQVECDGGPIFGVMATSEKDAAAYYKRQFGFSDVVVYAELIEPLSTRIDHITDDALRCILIKK